MRRRALVFCAFLLAVAVAVIEPTAVFLALLTFCVLMLSVGYRFRQPLASFVAGWLLYYPMANAVSLVAGGVLGYLSAGAVAVLLAERLSLDSEMAKVLEAPEGVDAEAEKRAISLRAAHGRTLGWYLLLCAAVVAASVPVAAALSFAPVIITAAVLLMFVAYSYVRR